MATLILAGFETRTIVANTEILSVTGSPSINTATPRTGAACLAISAASGAAELVRIGGVETTSATGLQAAWSRTAETFYTFYFRFTNIPTLNSDFAAVVTAGGTNVVVVNITSAGAVRLIGATTSATIATVSTGIWYRMDLRCTSNGTTGGAIDGGTEQTCTAQNQTQGLLQLGRPGTTATALDVLFDDVYVDTVAFPGAVEIKALYPTGAGHAANWANGTGVTFAEVDDWATGTHDTDTTYIGASATDDGDEHSFDVTTCASAGITGTIKAVQEAAMMRTGSTSGTSNVLLSYWQGATPANEDIGELTTSYTLRYTTPTALDPTNAAWTTSNLDSVTWGVTAGTLAQVQRCTALLVYVAYVPISGTLATPDPVAIRAATVAPAPKLAHTGTATALRLATVAPAPKTLHTATATALTVATVAPSPSMVARPAAVNILATVPAPSVSLLVAEIPVALELTVAEESPRLLIQRVPDPVLAEVVTVAPAVSLVASPAPVALVLTTVAPSTAQPTVVTPGPVGLEVVTVAPALAIASAQAPIAAELTMVAPTAALASTQVAGSLLVTLPAPALKLTATPAPVALEFTTAAPSTDNSTIVEPAPVALIVTTLAPSVSLRVTPAPVELRLTTVAPSRALSIPVGTLALAVALPAPSVSVVARPAAVSLQMLSIGPALLILATPAPVALRLTIPAPEGTAADLTPIELAATFSPLIGLAGSYVLLLALPGRFAPTLSLEAEYIDGQPFDAVQSGPLELIGSY